MAETSKPTKCKYACILTKAKSYIRVCTPPPPTTYMLIRLRLTLKFIGKKLNILKQKKYKIFKIKSI
jgi:hypothetical protein